METWNLSTRLTEIREITLKYFEIVDELLIENRLLFYANPEPGIKEKFKKYYREMKRLGNFYPFLDKEGDRVRLTIVEGVKHPEMKKKIPVILLIITLFTASLDGYLNAFNPVYRDIMSNYNPINTLILYVIAIMGIVGIHELGHKYILNKYGIKSDWPKFIPGVPGILPTFGAVISQREPAVNRDELFDIGMAGPLSGFIITLIVSMYTSITVPIISEQQFNLLRSKYGEGTPIPVPLIYILIQDYIRPVSPNQVVIMTPLLWATIIGFFITGLNLLPAWQLDGGHMARAFAGEKYHGVLTMVSVGILFLLKFWLMAALVLGLYLMSGGRSARPLDDISPLSPSRKIMFIIMLTLAILCLPSF